MVQTNGATPEPGGAETLSWADLEAAQAARVAAATPTPQPAAPSTAISWDPAEVLKRFVEGLQEVRLLLPELAQLAAQRGRTAAPAAPRPGGIHTMDDVPPDAPEAPADEPAAPAPAAAIEQPGAAAYRHLEALVEYVAEQAPALRYDQLLQLVREGLASVGQFVPRDKPIGPTLLSNVRTFEPIITAYLAQLAALQDPIEPPKPKRGKAKAPA